jgi:hypothetical protein
MIGTAEITRWRTVAHDVDGVVQAAEVGKRTERVHAYFAWRAEADEWVDDLRAAGFEDIMIGSAATSYFGPTDAPGNCWFVSAEMEAAE